jgi:hypothetical protein
MQHTGFAQALGAVSELCGMLDDSLAEQACHSIA